MRNRTVVCIGDSLTQGGWVRLNFPTRLAGKYPGTSFVNLGVGGDTAVNIANTRLTDPDQYQPFRVIVWAGINDIDYGFVYNSIVSALITIYQYYKVTKGYEVWAVTITPQDVNSLDRNVMRNTINDWIKNSAANVDRVIDAWSIIRDPIYQNKRMSTYRDPATPNHINDAGYEAIIASLPSV